MRIRVSIVIIENKSLLVLKGSKHPYNKFYFTPGGKVEENETALEAVDRECFEEIGIKPNAVKYFLSYTSLLPGTNEKQLVKCYLAELDTSKLNIGAEITKYKWYTKSNYLSNDIKLAESIYENLIPKLIEKDII